jgi:hypothetical protein
MNLGVHKQSITIPKSFISIYREEIYHSLNNIYTQVILEFCQLSQSDLMAPTSFRIKAKSLQRP